MENSNIVPVTQQTLHRDWFAAGFVRTIPVIPPHAPLHEHSRVDPDMRGKVPGDFYQGAWDGSAGWTSYQMTQLLAERWDGLGANVGLLMGLDHVALDADLMDPETAQAVRAMLGFQPVAMTAPIRTGQAPKFLLLFRVAPGEVIRRRQFSINRGDVTDKVEVLGTTAKGSPSQAVVAGLHPSGAWYQWDRPIVLDQVPVITATQMDELIEICLTTCEANGWTRGRISQMGGMSGTVSPLAKIKTDPQVVRDLVALIPNPDLEYDDWIQIGLAIKWEMGDDGRDLWLQWSVQADKDVPAKTARAWDGFDPKGGANFSKLEFWAEELGATIPDDLTNNIRAERNRKQIEVHMSMMPDAPQLPPGAMPIGTAVAVSAKPTQDIADWFRDLVALGRNRQSAIDPRNLDSNSRLLMHKYFMHDGKPTLTHWRGNFYRWIGTHWEAVPDKWVADILFHWFSKLVCTERTDSKGVTTRDIIPPTKVFIANYVAALQAVAARSGSKEQGWPDGLSGAWQAVQNGILDMNTGTLTDHTPEFFNTTWIDAQWNPDAQIDGTAAAGYFRDMLVWDDQIILMQEFFGYVLSGDTSLQKAGMLIGQKRCGKGTLTRLWKAMLGGLVASIRSKQLADTFVMEGTIGKSLMLVPDVRLNKDSDFATIAELILTITGEDDVDVRRMHKTSWQGRTTVRMVMLANSVPMFRDGDGVLASRFMYFMCPNSFYGKEDANLLDNLLAERDAILKWAVDGWQRLRAQGHFSTTISHQNLMSDGEIRMDPVGQFVAQRLDITGDWNDFIGTGLMLDYFNRFTADYDIGPFSEKGFSGTLKNKPLNIRAAKDATSTIRGFRGLKWKSQDT